jgi:hypothetical protein
MLEYLQKTNPYFDSPLLDKQFENSPYYTDTDSIQIHCKNLTHLSLNKEIGGISDDLGENCKILWIAPKLYFLEYVEKSGEIKYHLQGKRVLKDKLTIEMFEEMMKGEAVRIAILNEFMSTRILHRKK